MPFQPIPDTPFQVQFSFDQLVTRMEKRLVDQVSQEDVQLARDLEELKSIPQLRTNINDISEINEHRDLIARLLKDYFPPALTSNEIKAVTLPYSGIIFNHTKRFADIIKAAGSQFTFNIRDFDDHQFYVLSCCLILNGLYGTSLDFSKPLFYDIPMANGVIKHYRILYNADFLDILPTEKSINLSRDQIDELIDNYNDISLWKSKFPSESYILKGFAIMTLVDVTIENAVSLFKEKLLTLYVEDFQENVESIFRSIYRNPDIRIGFVIFNENEGMFSVEGLGYKINSFLLQGSDKTLAKNVLCANSYRSLVDNKKYFSISDTIAFHDEISSSPLAAQLRKQGIRSVILAPVVKNDHMFGVLEVASSHPRELNSINANKLDVMMPFLTDTIERLAAQFQNRVQAIIQSNYTSLHPSVYWKFRDAAQKSIHLDLLAEPHKLPEIIFENVYPLYGQIDIKGSSDARNESTRKDLLHQLQSLLILIGDLSRSKSVTPDFSSARQQLETYINVLKFPIHAGTEQLITHYLESQVHGMLDQITEHPLSDSIIEYFKQINKSNGEYHQYRRMYDETISSINDKMVSIIDSRQSAAQQVFPHYYERFKTDGVDHSIYIGDSIAPTKNLTPGKLNKIRQWQLETLCEMERAHFLLRSTLPYPLEVTTLLLIHSMPLSIRFRMDEKRFDVDGSYNARFEIIKKRIDKAYLKGTLKRLTEAGKIALVYSDDAEAEVYVRLIKELNIKGFLDDEIEHVDIEDLQGVTGLKALRVKFSR